MRLRRLLRILLALCPTLAGAAPVWVARYDGPAHDIDRPYALALDRTETVFVTGGSGGIDTYQDYTTVAYNRSGSELWVARYDGPAHGDDNAFAVVPDGFGGCVVTGRSMNQLGDYDFVTIRYRADGQEAWLVRLDGTGHGSDVARAIAAGPGGTFFVLGESLGPGTGLDYLLVKYDSTGSQVWSKRYDGSARKDDIPYGLAVDAFGTVYVTGSSITSGNNADILTVKYDASGNQLWTAHYNGTAGFQDVGKKVAVDGLGNIYVGGVSWGTGNHNDYALLKYDNAGHELWVARYDGSFGGEDVFTDLALTVTGDAYVTGTSQTAQGFDCATLAYDPAGTQRWRELYGGTGDDAGNAIALDIEQNVFIAGQSQGTTGSYDYLTFRYTKGGSRGWVERYDGPAAGDDVAVGLAIGLSGHVYVTGRSAGLGTESDFATVCYTGATGVTEPGREPFRSARVRTYPASHGAVFELDCPTAGTVSVQVCNCLGQVVARENWSLPSGSSRRFLALPVGVSYAVFAGPDWSATVKVVSF